MRVGRSFLSEMRTVLKYTRVFELQHVLSFAETPIDDIVDGKMQLQYLLKYLRCFYVPYVRFRCLMAKNSNELSLLAS